VPEDPDPSSAADNARPASFVELPAASPARGDYRAGHCPPAVVAAGRAVSGLTWLYVTDRLILGKETRAVTILHHLFSFNGRITDRIHLLISSVGWMFAIYLFAELFGTLSTVLMSIVGAAYHPDDAQRGVPQAPGAEPAYLHRQRIGD
jgi:hypothetical protein